MRVDACSSAVNYLVGSGASAYNRITNGVTTVYNGALAKLTTHGKIGDEASRLIKLTSKAALCTLATGLFGYGVYSMTKESTRDQTHPPAANNFCPLPGYRPFTQREANNFCYLPDYRPFYSLDNYQQYSPSSNPSASESPQGDLEADVKQPFSGQGSATNYSNSTDSNSTDSNSTDSNSTELVDINYRHGSSLVDPAVDSNAAYAITGNANLDSAQCHSNRTLNNATAQPIEDSHFLGLHDFSNVESTVANIINYLYIGQVWDLIRNNPKTTTSVPIVISSLTLFINRMWSWYKGKVRTASGGQGLGGRGSVATTFGGAAAGGGGGAGAGGAASGAASGAGGLVLGLEIGRQITQGKKVVVLAEATAQNIPEVLRAAVKAFQQGNLRNEQEILKQLRAHIRLDQDGRLILLLLMDNDQGVVLKNLLNQELGFKNKKARDNFLKIIQNEATFDDVDVKEGDRSAVSAGGSFLQNGRGHGGGGGSKDDSRQPRGIAGSDEGSEGGDQGSRRREGLIKLPGLGGEGAPQVGAFNHGLGARAQTIAVNPYARAFPFAGYQLALNLARTPQPLVERLLDAEQLANPVREGVENSDENPALNPIELLTLRSRT